MATLCIIQGFLGAGKSTYSRKLAHDISAIRLNADEWVEQNVAIEDQQKDWDSCFSKAINTLWAEAETQIRNGTDVILDFGFWSRESRDYARAKVAEWGAGFRHYYIYAPDEVLLERLKQRSGGPAQSNYENFHSLKTYFEEPGESEDPVVIQNH